MDHRTELQNGLRAARERADRLLDEDRRLAERETKLTADVSPPPDAEALADVRNGASLAQKRVRGVESLRHEIEVFAGARRALAAEIAVADGEVASLTRTLDRVAMRSIGARAIANGTRIDRLIAELDAALAESEVLYAEALSDGLAFRLGIQPDLMDYLAGAFRVSSALSHRLRVVARSTSADARRSVEQADREFFKQFE